MKTNSLQVLLILIFALFQIEISLSQTVTANQETQAVQQVIEQLFEAMRAGDSTALRQVFHEEARLQTALQHPQTKATRLVTESIDNFIRQVSTSHPEMYDERILDYDIKIDCVMATAWTPYRFYVGDKFSHCGVNAFQLFKTAEGWKIIQIIDTRSQQDCEE